jgi:UDP-N-acetylmuramoyl-tripeptide--D-alanyl-D-alanine ligase
MNLIRGINGSLIIDDTYNSSPTSALAALSTMGQIKAERKIVVFGDMLELGEGSIQGHLDVIKNVLEGKFDKLIIIGKRMHEAGKTLLGDNNDIKSVLFFNNPTEAGKILAGVFKEGDLILVKGSQSMRMEKVIEEIIADPTEIPSALCRQSKSWKNKEFKEV